MWTGTKSNTNTIDSLDLYLRPAAVVIKTVPELNIISHAEKDVFLLRILPHLWLAYQESTSGFL